MNIIADRLFALLLGWTGSLFNGLWNLITNEGGAFSGFLRSFWLPLIVILLLFGTVVDYAIWLIRWRPYYVWSSWLRRVIGRRRLHQTQSYMEDLDHSPLDLPEYQGESGAALYDEPIYFDFQATPYQEETPAYFQDDNYQPLSLAEDPAQAEQQLQDLPPAFVPSLPWENVRPVPIANFPEPSPDQMPEELPYEELPQAEPLLPPFEEQPYHPDDLYLATLQETAAPEEAPAQSHRKRRVDSRRRRSGNMLKSIRDTLFDSTAEQEGADVMEPPVNPEAAFHKPFYPQSYSYREQPGKPPSPPQA